MSHVVHMQGGKNYLIYKLLKQFRDDRVLPATEIP